MKSPVISDIVIEHQKRPTSQVMIDRHVARLVRKVAKVERRSLSDVLCDMLILYVKHKHPSWHIEFREENGQ